MPSLYEHCMISEYRTKNQYMKLHEWIDDSQKDLGENHRMERHTYNEIYREFVKKKFGEEEAVIEWLIHIALDNLQTAYKTSKYVYGKDAWNHYEIKFTKKGDVEYVGKVRK